eukprot:gene21492-25852_t
MLYVILTLAATSTIKDLAASRLKLVWRQVSTERLLVRYLDERGSFYRLKAARSVPNADARIAEDLASIVDEVVNLTTVLPSHFYSFFRFTSVMWQTSPRTCLLLWTYALLGTFFTRHYLGKHLAECEDKNRTAEAHYRFKLLRVAEFAESIAFYRAGCKEREQALFALSRLTASTEAQLRWRSGLHIFQRCYSWVASMLPSMIMAPLYWEGKIEFGTISQMFFAFRSVKDGLLYLADNSDTLSKLAACAQRLDQFQLALTDAGRQPISCGASMTNKPEAKISFQDLSTGSQLLVLRDVRVSIPGNVSSHLDVRMHSIFEPGLADTSEPFVVFLYWLLETGPTKVLLSRVASAHFDPVVLSAQLDARYCARAAPLARQ